MTQAMRVAVIGAMALAIFVVSCERSIAYTCAGASCTPSISYTEPSTYTSGAPLTDLKDGVFTYQLNGGANQTFVIPASKPQGSGVISAPLAPQSIAVCTIGTITGTLVMRTIAGTVSAATIATPLVIDRTKLATGLPDPACTTPNPAAGVIVN